ncbi:MAG: tetratricopeptide repeat protein, partial [Anaerolineae bacterium]
QFFYHYEFGQVYSSYLNDAPNAILEYQKAIALFAPYVPSYIALGRAYLAQNQPGPAILQFQKALTFDSNSNEAFVGLGLSFQKQGRCPQAIPYFQKSLESNPKGNEALRGLADCGGLAQGQPTPGDLAIPTPGLNAVPTAIVQATVVPLVLATPTVKTTPVAGAASPTGGTTGQGRIAYSIFDGQQYRLFIANLDGSNRLQIPDKDGVASQPAFSPDGSQLLYYSWAKDQRGIHRIEANGMNDEFLSKHQEDILPSWSPDGTQYIYSTRAGQGLDINKRAYNLRIDDPTTRANQDPLNFTTGQYPTWGPKGQIAFRDCGYPTDRCGLAVIDADGTNKKTVVSDSMDPTAPAWSPDGKYIVFMSNYGSNWDVYIVLASGGSPSRLTTDPAEDGLPTFSPDGKQIAYISHRNGVWSIWAMGIDGSNQHKLFDLGGDITGSVPGNVAGQPGQVWTEQRISWH